MNSRNRHSEPPIIFCGKPGWQLVFVTLFMAAALFTLTACDDDRAPNQCTVGTTCDTGDPCRRGQNVCDADGTAHCVVTVVEPNCPPQPATCLNGTSCDTGDPCLRGSTVCGADDTPHCVAGSLGPGCPVPAAGECVEGTSCNTGNPCLRGQNTCGIDGRSHCVVTVVETLPGCS